MARTYLVGITLLICAADALLFWYSFSQHNPWRQLVGFMFGQAIGSFLLVAGIWKRMPWARYVLAILIIVVITVFSLQALYLIGMPDAIDQRTVTLIWIAVGLLVAADTWLIRSKRIQYLASQSSSGG
jgi:predicted membrane channel-forming protein YqfA (hemolysin III family)